MTGAVDSGAAVEAERQTPSMALVGAVRCVARASAVPPAGVEGLAQVAAAAVGAEGAAVGAEGAGDEAGELFLSGGVCTLP